MAIPFGYTAFHHRIELTQARGQTPLALDAAQNFIQTRHAGGQLPDRNAVAASCRRWD
jgi:hypothetical protein